MKKPIHFRKFARNRRAARTERQGAGGISKFLFWGEDLSGSFQGAGGVGGLIAHMEKTDSTSWTAYYYHPDANGNIAAVTSPFRALAAKFSYDAFGRTTSQSGPKSGIDIHALNYRFSTKPMELELATSNSTLVPPPVSSGLYYYGYRFYSPNLGRWISRDPIREKGGRNLYGMLANDAVNATDYLGYGWWDDIAGSAAPSNGGGWSGTCTQWWQSFKGAVGLTASWCAGTSVRSQTFAHGTQQTKDMSDANKVNEARNFFYRKNSAGTPCENLKDVSNYQGNFGLTGLLAAGLDPTEQFVGSYRIDIQIVGMQDGNCDVEFVLENTTSFKSLAYGIAPDWERQGSSWNPTYIMSNTSQTYRWREKWDCSSGTLSKYW